MLPIVSVVGHPGSGRSSLVDALAGEFETTGRRVAVIRQGGPGPGYADAAIRLAMGDLDLVIVDGTANESDPRIEVHFSENGDEILTAPDKLLAVVSPADLATDCPRFAPDQTGELAAFLEEKLVEDGSHGTVLLVNGDPVPLSPFPQKIITKTILGMVSSLKGVGEVRSVSIITRTGTGSSRENSGGDD